MNNCEQKLEFVVTLRKHTGLMRVKLGMFPIHYDEGYETRTVLYTIRNGK